MESFICNEKWALSRDFFRTKILFSQIMDRRYARNWPDKLLALHKTQKGKQGLPCYIEFANKCYLFLFILLREYGVLKLFNERICVSQKIFEPIEPQNKCFQQLSSDFLHLLLLAAKLSPCKILFQSQFWEMNSSGEATVDLSHMHKVQSMSIIDHILYKTLNALHNEICTL